MSLDWTGDLIEAHRLLCPEQVGTEARVSRRPDPDPAGAPGRRGIPRVPRCRLQ
jgi:hypothetical protein